MDLRQAGVTTGADATRLSREGWGFRPEVNRVVGSALLLE
jgi:hypothetical protein